jgi:hypothetical protein
VQGWLELTRAVMVADSERSVWAALRRAFRSAARPPVPIIWVLISLPTTGLTLAALMPPAVDDPYALIELLGALAFGQAVAFLGAWTKVVRLAVAARLASSALLASRASGAGRSPLASLPRPGG